jgi:hypothetical protein
MIRLTSCPTTGYPQKACLYQDLETLQIPMISFPSETNRSSCAEACSSARSPAPCRGDIVPVGKPPGEDSDMIIVEVALLFYEFVDMHQVHLSAKRREREGGLLVAIGPGSTYYANMRSFHDLIFSPYRIS